MTFVCNSVYCEIYGRGDVLWSLEIPRKPSALKFKDLSNASSKELANIALMFQKLELF